MLSLSNCTDRRSIVSTVIHIVLEIRHMKHHIEIRLKPTNEMPNYKTCSSLVKYTITWVHDSDKHIDRILY